MSVGFLYKPDPKDHQIDASVKTRKGHVWPFQNEWQCVCNVT